ncbi:MAG: DUF4190 domain-containing protein [Pyrinomonadaceae bacterium]
MKFCQTDGTPLVEDKPSAPPADPFKTIVGGMVKEEDILQIPDSYDPMKTMVSTSNAPKFDEPKKEAASKESSPDVSPKNDSPSPVSPPKPVDSPPNPPSFGDLSPQSGSSGTTKPKSFDATFSSIEPPSFGSKGDSSSPFDKPSDAPFGSPQKDEPPPTAFGSLPFDAPKPPPPSFKDPEPFNAGQSPYSSPLGVASDPWGAPQNTPFGGQSDWNPPPAPVAEWQNQGLGANTPFQPPVAGQGQNQTLPIISLVLGILSLCCYVSPLTGIGALVTGYLGMKNANTDPANYGGRTLAIVGMSLGGFFLVIGILWWILELLGVIGSILLR